MLLAAYLFALLLLLPTDGSPLQQPQQPQQFNFSMTQQSMNHAQQPVYQQMSNASMTQQGPAYGSQPVPMTFNASMTQQGPAYGSQEFQAHMTRRMLQFQAHKQPMDQQRQARELEMRQRQQALRQQQHQRLSQQQPLRLSQQQQMYSQNADPHTNHTFTIASSSIVDSYLRWTRTQTASFPDTDPSFLYHAFQLKQLQDSISSNLDNCFRWARQGKIIQTGLLPHVGNVAGLLEQSWWRPLFQNKLNNPSSLYERIWFFENWPRFEPWAKNNTDILVPDIGKNKQLYIQLVDKPQKRAKHIENVRAGSHPRVQSRLQQTNEKFKQKSEEFVYPTAEQAALQWLHTLRLEHRDQQKERFRPSHDDRTARDSSATCDRCDKTIDAGANLGRECLCCPDSPTRCHLECVSQFLPDECHISNSHEVELDMDAAVFQRMIEQVTSVEWFAGQELWLFQEHGNLLRLSKSTAEHLVGKLSADSNASKRVTQWLWNNSSTKQRKDERLSKRGFEKVGSV